MPTCARPSLALLAAAAALVAAPAATGAEPVVLDATVERVIDGDTVRVRSRGFQTTVRLIGIDTPETVAPGRPVQCFGPEATARARALLPAGAALRLVGDPTQDTRDRYGRLLSYVYRRGSSVSVNLRLVRSGHARVYVYRPSGPFRHAASYRRAERVARAARRGLWGPPCLGRTDRPAPAARPVASAPPGCDPNYAGACVPVSAADLDCADVRALVRVVGTDRHRLDGRDQDGWGCEAYR